MTSTNKNTGSADAQIAIWSERIEHLKGHYQTNKKDYAAKRGLLNMVSKRKRMLKYLRRENSALHKTVCEKFSLRG
jgi:small subunit ribosomal protein S15